MVESFGLSQRSLVRFCTQLGDAKMRLLVMGLGYRVWSV